MTHEEQIATIIKQLTTAKEQLFNATETLIKAQQARAAAINTALLSGAIDGKNAEIREAQLAQIVKPATDALHDAETAHRRAKMAHDLAELAMDAMKLLSSFAV